MAWEKVIAVSILTAHTQKKNEDEIFSFQIIL